MASHFHQDELIEANMISLLFICPPENSSYIYATAQPSKTGRDIAYLSACIDYVEPVSERDF